MKLNSKIKQVTVYRDRAYIERSVMCNLKKGVNNIIIQELPDSIDANSLQVYSNDNLILQDIKLQPHSKRTFSDEEKQNTIAGIKKITASIQQVKNKQANLKETKEVFKRIFNIKHRLLHKSSNPTLEYGEIEKSLQFYNDKLDEIDSSIQKGEEEINKLIASLEILNDNAKGVDYNHVIRENRLYLKILSDVELETNIGFSYLTYNASWKAFYDMRLNSEAKKLNVEYNAIISQETGEDWQDVELKLSTAQAQLAGNLPKITPWYVDVYVETEDLDYMMYDAVESSTDFKRKKSRAPVSETVEAVMPKMSVAKATVENATTSVVFDLEGVHTVLANSEEHKVGIVHLQFDAELEYNSVPKLNPMSYLTAKTKNNSEFTLLKGKANIFLDNNFVSQSNIKFIAPSEEFKTYLGVDQNIKIKHKLVNKFTKTEGLLSKKNKVVFDYKMVIENHKTTEVKINIKDQIPVSQNNDIKVELINPNIKEDSDNLKKSKDGTIEWIIVLKSKETKELDLKFAVEYPKDIEVSGL